MDEPRSQQTPTHEPEGKPVNDASGSVNTAGVTRCRREQLETLLSHEMPDLGLGDLRVIGGGLESVVYRADSAKFGPVAIKVPLKRVLSTGNEPSLDTRELLSQEFRLAGHVRGQGVHCPEPFVLHTSDESVDCLIVEYVETDGTKPSMEALGELVRRIHRLDVDPLPLVAMEGDAFADVVISRRLSLRYQRLRARVPSRMPPLTVAAALVTAGRLTETPALLHMDARPANLLVRDGEIRGLVDWSNALFGPPPLELARIAESGNLTPAFLAGYGLDLDPFHGIGPVREVVYRLDTAVMLAHVFLDNHAQPAVRQRQIARVVHLATALAEGTRPDDSFIFQPDLLPKT